MIKYHDWAKVYNTGAGKIQKEYNPGIKPLKKLWVEHATIFQSLNGFHVSNAVNCWIDEPYLAPKVCFCSNNDQDYFSSLYSTFRWVSEWNCGKLWHLKSFQIVSSQVNSYNDTVQFHKHQSSLKCLNSCLRFYFQKSTMFDLDFHFQPRELQIRKILCQLHVSMLSKSSMNWFSWRWQAWGS